MPKVNNEEVLCVDNIRHSEYYNMLSTFDDLYERSQKGETFDDLMSIILSEENILLAYRTIKTNDGSSTPGTDKLTIADIGKLTPKEVVDKVRYIVSQGPQGYRPRPVRRKEIPKPNGKTRPLGIPCIWDRLIQQCIKQVLEPICEAKFSDNSYGFRPQRSAEHAIQRTNQYLYSSKLHYVIEFDIEGFFDNVNHSKLMRQIWAMGIHDKQLIFIIKRMLTAPIKMQDGSMIIPSKGTPQGGILSPLLANIVLNELDHWIESQWQENPLTLQKMRYRNGSPDRSCGYRYLRNKTNLKEMYIVRYADDFRVFCRTKTDANKTMIAVTEWLRTRLKLNVSKEKTRIVNVKRKETEFLGFRIKLVHKGKQYVTVSHVSHKALSRIKETLTSQAKKITKQRKGSIIEREIKRYNKMVMGKQNYYRIASRISEDLSKLQWEITTILHNRLKVGKKGRIIKRGRNLTKIENERYGKSDQLIYDRVTKEPIYPIGFVKFKAPEIRNKKINQYTPKGREKIHQNLGPVIFFIRRLLDAGKYDSTNSIEFVDNQLSLFSAQDGRCAITGDKFQSLEEIRCIHRIPLTRGGTDRYRNLIIIKEPIYFLTQCNANDHKAIAKVLKKYPLTVGQLDGINRIRIKAQKRILLSLQMLL